MHHGVRAIQEQSRGEAGTGPSQGCKEVFRRLEAHGDTEVCASSGKAIIA